jgi:hypothetical protein
LGWSYGTKKFLFPYGAFSIRDGYEIGFLEDKWMGVGNLPTKCDI